MKTLVYYCSLFYLIFAFNTELGATYSSYDLELLLDNCRKIEQDIEKVEKDIRKETSSRSRNRPSLLDEAKAKYEEAKQNLERLIERARRARENNSTAHGSSVVRTRRNAEQALADARAAYANKLAKIRALHEQWLELLKKLREECEEEFEESGGESDIDHAEEKIEEYKNKEKELLDEAVAETLEKLGADPENEEDKAKLPWTPPTRNREEDESRKDYKKRRNEWKDEHKKSKWVKDDFWKKVMEEIERLFSVSQESEGSDEDGDGLPNDEESSLPYDGDGDYIHYDFRFAGELESSNVGFHLPPSLPELEHTIYSDPERFIGLMEALNAEHVMVDISNFDNFNPVFPQRTTYYGLTASMEAFPQVETSLRIQYGQRSATMDLPFTMFSFDGETRSVKGNWTANRQSFRLSGGAEYRLGSGSTQLLFGPRIGVDQISGDNEITVGSTGWTDQIETDRQLFYGLGLGLRQQLNGAAFSELRASLERQAGATNFLLGVRFGLSH